MEETTIDSTEWHYCSVCNSKTIITKNGDDNTRVHCEICGHTVYDSPWVGTIALISNSNGELLLLKRATEPALGKWDIPGGFLAAGETLEECLVREVFEETNLIVESIEYFGSYPSDYGGRHSCLSVAFKCSVTNTQVTLCEENQEYGWFKKQDLPKLGLEDVDKAVKDWSEQ